MITQEDVKKAARLAKLKFTDEETAKYAGQLGNIMGMIDELGAVNIGDVKPLTSVHDAQLRMREDHVTEKDLGADLFANAPGKDAAFAKEIKCFIVPKVVE